MPESKWIEDQLDKLPNWIRWITIVPVALSTSVIAFFGYYILTSATTACVTGTIISDSPFLNLLITSSANAVSGVVFALSVYYVAPSKKIEAALTISIICTAIGLYAFLFHSPFHSSVINWQKIVYGISAAAGVAYALRVCFKGKE